MDWNFICWCWFMFCANHNILKKTINNDDEILFENNDKLQKESGLDERYNNNIFRTVDIKDNNFNYTMNRNLVIKNIVNTLEDNKKPINFKLQILDKYNHVIYNKTEGITIINGGLFDDWDFDFTL